MSGSPLAIDVRELHKTFRIPAERVHRLKERAIHPLRGTRYHELHVLNDVSFDVGRGEFFGIVGVNGSGKSTLLKLLASIYRADRGSIRVAGKLTPFIELGVGFNPELTAHDNVLLNAVMMGLTPEQARLRFDEVMDYAGLREFTELQLKNYSSGMQVRLAFSVMLQVDADVLLIDEVLAVGDAAFQEKCVDSLMDLHRRGKTIVFVTHSMPLVERFCDRAMLLDRGRIERIGEPVAVTGGYLNAGRSSGGALWASEPEVAADQPGLPAEVVELRITDEDGRSRSSVEGDERFEVEAVIEVREQIERAWVQLEVTDEHGTRAFGAASQLISNGARISPGERLRIGGAIENRLVPGEYRLSCVAMVTSAAGESLKVSNAPGVRLSVTGQRWDHDGLLALDLVLDVERESARAVVP